MIQLSLKQPHLSIKQLEDTELADFTILTGLNGTGKTHLLHAIRDGKIVLNGIAAQEIVYFNYNDFVVNPHTDQNHAQFKQNAQKSQQYRSNLVAIHNTELQKLRNKINSNKDPLEYALETVILNAVNFNKDFPIGTDADFQFFKENVETVKTSSTLNEFKDKVSEQFFIFMSHFLAKNGDPALLNRDEFMDKFTETKKRLEDELILGNSEYYNFVKSNVGEFQNILRLNANDFEHISVFASEIAEEIKEYAIRQCDNDHNEIRATKRNEKVSFLTHQEFVKKYGNPPLKVLNAVLNEYDCNGYQFRENNFYPKPGQDINATAIPVQLIHKLKGHSANIDQLSSGEQTLLALAMIVYKARKGRILPRVLLLDEIDSALHPSMISRLLNVIETIFVSEKKMKVIIATHSPTTVALCSHSHVYVINNDKKCEIVQKPKKEVIEFQTDGFATLEKGLKLFDQVSKRKISIITEGNNIQYLQKANSFFGNTDIEIIDNVEGCSGKNQLKTIFDFFSQTQHNNQVIIVWDSDVNFELASRNNTYPYILPKNSQNNKVKKGIENLFPESVFLEQFYNTQVKDDGGHHSSLDKKAFEKYIIDNGTINDFENLKPLFEWITKTLVVKTIA
jgi:ABC-type cobalamin/Fe3+-siderophores transport system ATPase subunit